ncbi:MAG: glutaredoxin domain-containing protein [Bacteroidota bacterium]
MTGTEAMNGEVVTMYSTTWCPDCHRAKMYLSQWGIDFKEINIEQTPGAAEQVMAWANGKRVVPTITVGEKVLVNPRMRDLAQAIGIVEN